MDLVAERAADDYHRLLRDEPALTQEFEERFFARLHAAGATFGGRVLCPFLRPAFVSPGAYDQVRSVCRHIFAAVERLETALGPRLGELVGLTPAERELAAAAPGAGRSSPTSRLDAFLTPAAYQFVELNAESPAGIAYNEVLAEVFLELPLLRRFQQRHPLRGFQGRRRLLETLLACHRGGGGSAERPRIAIVDYDDVPTRTEHHLFREFFEAQGYPAIVCDPRRLEYDGGRLRHDGAAIDIVYRRLLVNELLERAGELEALLQAARRGAVTIVNPFRCKAIHKKAIFAALTDDALQQHLSAEQRAAVAAHVPWTRLVSEQRTSRHGAVVDLPEFIRASRERLVLKPNDEYGGKGVFIGWESSAAEWDAALAKALAGPYVVQERVELRRERFPVLAPDLQLRDYVVDLNPFLFDGEVEGLLTRLSTTSLANVTSGGGQVPALIVAR